MRLNNIIVPLLLVTPSLAYYDVLNHWSESDLRTYLKDNSISVDKKSTLDELKDLASEHWNEAQYHTSQQPWYDYGHLKQKALNLYQGRPLNAPPQGSASDYYNTVRDWVFDTWTETDLKRLLRKYKIKYHATATHDELVKLAKDNYDSIAKSAKASGKYLGDWLYDSWGLDDLTSWLDEYKIDYDKAKDSKDALVKKVREHAYEASKYTQEERDSILDNLDLTAKSLFDKAGKIKADVFNTWSANQLYRWLKNHQIKVDQSLKNNKEELALIAQKHTDKFHQDVEQWSSKASKSASPLLSKATDAVDNVINDTFFVGIESWSRDRLKAFLESRGVKPSFFTTKKELISLVKQNKYKPIQNYNVDSFFEGWSKANIQKWISEQNSAISSNANGVADKLSDVYKDFVSSVNYYAGQAGDNIAGVQQSAHHNAEAIKKKAGDLRQGAHKHAESAVKYGKASYEKAENDASNAVNNAAKGASDVVSKAGADLKKAKDQFFDYWSDSELENYLTSFGIKPKKSGKSYSHEDLIKLAKQNTRWFLTGETYDTSTTGGQLRSHAENLYSKAQVQLKNLFRTVYSALGF
ncbi:hypothetical protein WICPIJ_002121 [Wickerhamomyces pijperi]|uniref:Meiotic sister chromatid recombination protein 1 n=1 Tax=Wickerhamomyces pijperi TaxID=599730 RepID=A0A9P8QCB7_WICPI|nr:hypothetical protein WICPIJ_002121 [Wickerhamomyces pijperi]